MKMSRSVLTNDIQDKIEFGRANEKAAIDGPSDSDSDEEHTEDAHVIIDQSGHPEE